MVRLHHLNCVEIESPFGMGAIGHCLLLEAKERLVLIDTGIGLLDTFNPKERIGQELIEMIGFRFDEKLTAVRQIEGLGLNPKTVTDCIISHMDNDHISGLSDFPKATVHVGTEEWENFSSGNPRYLQVPMAHNPQIKRYGKSELNWRGLELRKVDVSIDVEIFLVPLFGHTFGHCGVVVKQNSDYLFYIGDAYYLREELTDTAHPIKALVERAADDNGLRIKTIDKIRRFVLENPKVKVYGYHDMEEFAAITKKDN